MLGFGGSNKQENKKISVLDVWGSFVCFLFELMLSCDNFFGCDKKDLVSKLCFSLLGFASVCSVVVVVVCRDSRLQTGWLVLSFEKMVGDYF